MTTARRSSFFFHKLNSVLDSFCSSNEQTTSEEDRIILKHVDEVKRTISDWRMEYEKTKVQYKESQKFQNNVNIVEYTQCKDILLPEDLEFLKNRFDFSVLMPKLERLVKKIEIAEEKLYQVNTRMNGQVDALQQGITKIKRDICQFLLECDESADLFASN